MRCKFAYTLISNLRDFQISVPSSYSILFSFNLESVYLILKPLAAHFCMASMSSILKLSERSQCVST